ncbi:type VI secretion system protein TssA [Paraherbaspirillum soli]|uniref:Type VI secretion system protein TssA n=1 Tax=Paraherbaspirillum soli TaxID=631222 RepID=A0ABW0M582_9BURK
MNSIKKTIALRYPDLLEPVAADSPCGPNLEYDSAFIMLLAATAPKSDSQYGDFVGTPEPINWADVERDCRALLMRSKDIRLLVLLMRSRIRQDGAEGLRDGLALLQAMLERYPQQIHPALFDDGEHDPVMHANALAGLAEHSGILADMRNISLPKAAGLQLQLRDLEKSFALPRQKDAMPPEASGRLLKELTAKRDRQLLALTEAQQLAAHITSTVNAALGDDAPDLGMLNSLLQPFAPAGNETVCAAQPAAASDAEPEATPQPAQHQSMTAVQNPEHGAATVSAAPQPRRDRWTALAALRDVRDWFEQNEPSSPVIVLLLQAERMVGKRFSELAHIIPADLLAKWDTADE